MMFKTCAIFGVLIAGLAIVAQSFEEAEAECRSEAARKRGVDGGREFHRIRDFEAECLQEAEFPEDEEECRTEAQLQRTAQRQKGIQRRRVDEQRCREERQRLEEEERGRQEEPSPPANPSIDEEALEECKREATSKRVADGRREYRRIREYETECLQEAEFPVDEAECRKEAQLQKDAQRRKGTQRQRVDEQRCREESQRQPTQPTQNLIPETTTLAPETEMTSIVPYNIYDYHPTGRDEDVFWRVYNRKMAEMRASNGGKPLATWQYEEARVAADTKAKEAAQEPPPEYYRRNNMPIASLGASQLQKAPIVMVVASLLMAMM